jgi:hypothetical protein
MTPRDNAQPGFGSFFVQRDFPLPSHVKTKKLSAPLRFVKDQGSESMRNRYVSLLTLAICVVMLLSFVAVSSRTTGEEADAPPRPLWDLEDARPLMRAKLASSQLVFE